MCEVEEHYGEQAIKLMIGELVCIHWVEPDDSPGGMECVVKEVKDGQLIGDYGYGIKIPDIKSIHSPSECPGKE